MQGIVFSVPLMTIICFTTLVTSSPYPAPAELSAFFNVPGPYMGKRPKYTGPIGPSKGATRPSIPAGLLDLSLAGINDEPQQQSETETKSRQNRQVLGGGHGGGVAGTATGASAQGTGGGMAVGGNLMGIPYVGMPFLG